MRRFYTSDPERRQELVVEREYAKQDTLNQVKEGLSLERADQMIENAFAIYGLPYGLAFNFLIDGKDYVIPMVTEEPSVIAAASGAAKTIKLAGGFSTDTSQRQMIGQVALMEVADPSQTQRIIEENEQKLLDLANDAYPSIVKRGGGARSIRTKFIPADKGQNDFLVVYLSVDTQEAMGANMLNTMLEAIKLDLEDLSGGTALMGILSNYATDSLVSVRCALAFDQLKYKKIPGADLAKKIAAASDLAQDDIYRATTHNKGIMNGVDAVVLASGNDWRAIESGAHAYAARGGRYRGLATWTLEGDQLIGDMTLPLPIGAVGGSISLHPNAKATFEILNIEHGAKELAAVIASVGLAQNFAALRALVSEGIQKGHMALQAKSLAVAAGAKDHEVQPLVRQLKNSKPMNLAKAQELLDKLRKK